MTEKVQRTGAERPRLKTRCYYTDYVNHIIRFYLSTPETLRMEGKRKADIDHWLAAQDVFRKIGADERAILEEVFTATHHLPESVRMYCEKTGADDYKIWVLVTKTVAAVARRRGLV